MSLRIASTDLSEPLPPGDYTINERGQLVRVMPLVVLPDMEKAQRRLDNAFEAMLDMDEPTDDAQWPRIASAQAELAELEEYRDALEEVLEDRGYE